MIQPKREPLSFKFLRPVEPPYRKKIFSTLKRQVESVVSYELLGKAISKYNEIKETRKFKQGGIIEKKKSEEELLLAQFLEIELEALEEFSIDSEYSEQLISDITDLYQEVMDRGLIYDKKHIVEMLSKYKDNKRIAKIIAGTSLTGKVTNTTLLSEVENHIGELIKNVNSVTRERIKNFIVEGVKQGLSIEAIVANLTTLNDINLSRAYTIVRTELSRARHWEQRVYYTVRGLEFWQWFCNHPVDICLINCGVVRAIGGVFPSGHSSPGVHPSCLCYMDIYIPLNDYMFGIFLNNLESGEDWDGE